MAVEVAKQAYIFGNKERKERKERKTGALDRVLARARRTMELTSPVVRMPSGLRQCFFHNPLHDAESVWWGCVELLFKRRVESSSIPELQQQYKEKYTGLSAVASDIFPDQPSLGTRNEFLVDLLRHDEIMSHLPPSLTNISNILSTIRDYLVNCYVGAEQADDGTIRAEVYEPEEMSKFADLLIDARPLARGMNLTTFPKEWNTRVSPSPGVKNATQRASSKRKTSEPPHGSRKARRIHGESASEA
jgi:hypothetical protein